MMRFSSVFTCTRFARSNSGCPVIAGAWMPCLARARPTSAPMTMYSSKRQQDREINELHRSCLTRPAARECAAPRPASRPSGRTSPVRSGDALHELRVARREPLLVEPHVVLEPRAAMAAELERPFVDGELMPADAGRRPGRAGQHRARAARARTRAPRGRRAARPECRARTARARAPSAARRRRAWPRCRASRGRRSRSRASCRAPSMLAARSWISVG